MTAGIPVQVCSRCGRRFFPHRLACSDCGSETFTVETASEGTVEESTVVRRVPGQVLDEPVALATVRLGEGPRIVARVPPDARPGATLPLRLEGGAPVAG